MQPLTEKQTQRVWSRVMSAQTAPAAAMENPAPAAQAQSETLTPEKLLSLIDGERADSALYAHLAARMKGRAQAMLRAIAQQEACHAKKLAAVYFLNTGKKACPGRPERPCVTCINETLRQQYTAEHAAHEAYAALAENAGTHRCMLLRMAQEECEHAQLILCILNFLLRVSNLLLCFLFAGRILLFGICKFRLCIRKLLLCFLKLGLC